MGEAYHMGCRRRQVIILRDSGVYFSCFGALMGLYYAAMVEIGGPWTFAGPDLGAMGSVGRPLPPTPKAVGHVSWTTLEVPIFDRLLVGYIKAPWN